jgi:hypothetical protein
MNSKLITNVSTRCKASVDTLRMGDDMSRIAAAHDSAVNKNTNTTTTGVKRASLCCRKLLYSPYNVPPFLVSFTVKRTANPI